MKKIIFAFLAAALILQATLTAAAYAADQPTLEHHIFIHYVKSAKAKPPSTDQGYYKLLGVKWPRDKLPIKLEVNPDPDPDDGQSLDENWVKFVLAAVTLAAEEWDEGAYSRIDGDGSTTWEGVTVNLFEKIVINNELTYASDWGKYDGKNIIVWGNYETDNVIAVTSIWYNPRGKAILDFDIVLDTDYAWGNATQSDGQVMDLQNILTHELGHGLGLGDVYQTVAKQETMYGYSDYGETIKRSLYIGDQTGITKLYG